MAEAATSRVAPAERPPHALTQEEALAALASRTDGLGDAEARERLARFGPNVLRVARPASAWKILLDQFRSVVVLLLLVAAVVSLAVGDLPEAVAIGCVLLINTLLGWVIELRARRAMEALLRLEVPQAVVVRGGRPRVIDARELVPGDVIEVEAGVSVPADARLLDGAGVLTNEAPLTGESLPVEKTSDPVAPDTPLPDRSDMLYKGTTVVGGSGRALVVATGMETELGRIGRLVGGITAGPTPLEERLDALGRRLVWAALAAGVAVAVLGALRGLGWRELLQTGLALAVAAVPEGLPAVATITLALGVHRMAQRRALVRRLPSVETLGSVTVICTDKTGTLTAGEPTVTLVATYDADRRAMREVEVTGTGYEPQGALVEDGRPLEVPLPEPLEELVRTGVLANRALVERRENGWQAQGDPTEAALLVLGAKAGTTRERALAEEPLVGEVPFSSDRMLMATFHRGGRDGRTIARVKGAPFRILERCTRIVGRDGERPLDEDDRERILACNEALAGRGLRVLALACGEVPRADESVLEGLRFLGLVGMSDPLAPGVLDTIVAFREAGIRTVMVTGDQKLTAQAIGEQLGIVDGNRIVLDGRAIAGMSDEELAAAAERAGAFSRISPEDKLRIVTSLQRRGEIVAMLGDGVNDAAALRKADVGVAMGMRGTDVAKEAADVVLSDDRFATIRPAIEQGRVVFDDIRKFVYYLFSCNVAEVLVLLVGAAAVLELPLLPLQILWLNLVTDTFPALSLALEPAEPGIMQRPPRDPKAEIISWRLFRRMMIAASLITIATLAAFAIGRRGPDGDIQRAVTMSFSTLALAQALHLGNARRRSRVLTPSSAFANPWAVGAVVLVGCLQILAVHAEPLARVLHAVPLDWVDWLTVLGLAAIPAIIGQLSKPPPPNDADNAPAPDGRRS